MNQEPGEPTNYCSPSTGGDDGSGIDAVVAMSRCAHLRQYHPERAADDRAAEHERPTRVLPLRCNDSWADTRRIVYCSIRRCYGCWNGELALHRSGYDGHEEQRYYGDYSSAHLAAPAQGYNVLTKDTPQIRLASQDLHRNASVPQRLRRCLVYGALCMSGAGACTQVPPTSGSFARVINPGDSTWYLTPVGCTDSAIVVPPDSLRIPSFFGDTVRDSNAREAALARGIPGGWGGVWVEGDSFAIGLVDTSRRVDAVHALYARGYRVNGDLMRSRAQPVQWDFAQLDDWFNVIVPRAFEHRVVTGAGIDIMRNRIRLNTDVEQRPALRRLLASLDVPCYMVGIDRGLRGRF